jgi:hypothetical protein
MLLHAESGFRGKVIDLDTGKPVPKVIWLDTERGELEAYKTTSEGKYIRGLNGEFITYKARGNFRYIPSNSVDSSTNNTTRNRVVLGAPKCARCPSTLTLPGDDLCPPCRAKERGQRNKMLVERITTPLLDRPCCVKGCGRLASWSVSDEVSVTPSVGGLSPGLLALPRYKRAKRVLYERGCTVGRRWYCSRHYSPPRLLDAKGEVIETYDEIGVRPI